MGRMVVCAAMAAMAVWCAGSAATAQAEQWPWCAVMTVADTQSVNCGFASLAQCTANIDGIGGHCERNPDYVPERLGEPERQSPQR